jgi:pyrimidine operon attenuation protein/uracil phosphoribosyltransferase
MSSFVEILSAEELRRTVNRLASEIIERAPSLNQLALIGIYTRGVPLARLIGEQIQRLESVSVPLGYLDITFYRDDLDTIGIRTPAHTQIDFDLAGKTLVLVDDVIYSGRTIRAALNAVSDYGRPDNIQLAVLIDRGHRQLPIHPDFVGKVVPTAREESIKVYLYESDGHDAVHLIQRSGRWRDLEFSRM